MKRINPKKIIKIYKITEIIIIIAWLIAMKESDSYYIPYLLTGMLGIICCYTRKTFNVNDKKPLAIIFAIIFTLLISLSNYNLFPTLSLKNSLLFLLQSVSIIIGSFVTFYNILINSPKILNALKVPKKLTTKSNYKPVTIFLLSFITIAFIYLLVLLICKYPGNLSFDSITQIKQGLTQDYSNHHPFLSTIVISIFVNVGQAIFNDINVGIALFAIFQIVILSLIFSYSVMTIYQVNKHTYLWLLLLSIYAIIPYHIMYSMSVWKDVLFSGFVLLFVISQYRFFNNIGKKWVNVLLLSLSTILIPMFRGNGIYIIYLSIILFIFLFWKQIYHEKKYRINLSILILAITVYPIFNVITSSSFNIAKAEKMESLSIPAQQIARTIKDKNDLTDDQKELISNVSNFDEIADTYVPWLSDPIKEQVWHSTGGEEYLSTHKNDFVRIYLELGFTHPIQYTQAWVDQTKGYFNGGYNYWVISNDITENDLGIERKNEQSAQNKIFNLYLDVFEKNDFFRIIYCIGFHVWVIIWLLYCSLFQKRKLDTFIICIPLSLILTLLIASPVFSEFRYAYPLFCCLPFLAIIYTQHDKNKVLK